MKRKESESLGDVLRVMLQNGALSVKLNETRLMAAWTMVVGDDLHGRSGALNIKNRKLFVKGLPPMLKSNLMMQRQSLVQRLNEEVGGDVIDDIVFV